MTHDFDALLRLQPRGEAAFENEPLVEGHLYGGYSLGLAVRAAARTVPPGLQLHSVQAVFPSGGELGTPLTLDVRAVRDGRASAVRLVTVAQGPATPLLLTAAFHAGGGAGPDWQAPQRPLPVGPDDIAPDAVRLMGLDPVELRPAGPNRVDAGAAVLDPLHPYWVRPYLPLPDDPGLHAAVVAFVSDYMVIAAAQVPGAPPPNTRGVTLDHTLWFHRAVDAGEWLLYSAEPARVLGDRSLVRGTIRTEDGEVVASFAQGTLTFLPRS